MTKKLTYVFLIVFLLLSVGCKHSEEQKQGNNTNNTIDATQHGLSVDNDGASNSVALQTLIDSLSEEGGTIYIPSGEYEFAENGSQTIGSHCIKMRSHVSIIGDGEGTVLKPVGDSSYGLDMFYFNDYLDTGMAVYLEGCRFEKFVIDAIGTSSRVYTSAGKGFMFNLFKDCHWKGVTVKNTDATGFGVDCPIDSSITDCVAIGCGKAASLDNGGASGFGIGYGYCDDESFSINNCVAMGNKKFGFFFEHQGRFNSGMYVASATCDFLVSDSVAEGNYYGFGGICADGMTYEHCTSERSLRYGYYFEDCSAARVTGCRSVREADACFTVIQTGEARYTSDGIIFSHCVGRDTPIALYVVGEDGSRPIDDVRMQGCDLYDVARAVCTLGRIHALTLIDNTAGITYDNEFSDIDNLTDRDNVWVKET